MRSLYSVINEVSIYNMFETIDTNIICESLQSSILQDIVKQIKDHAKKDKEEREKNGYSYTRSTTFRALFGGRLGNTKWNEVKDSDFEISLANFDKENKKEVKARNEMLKKLRAIVKNNANAIVILKDPNTGKFTYLYDNYGDLNNVNSNTREYGYRGRHGSLTQAEKMAYADGKDIYYLDINKFSTSDIRRERNDKKRDAIAMYSPDQIRDIARDNIKRYKEIIAKNKVERMAKTDNISQEVSEVTKKVLELSEKVNSDVIKYADCVWDMTKLLTMIYDRKVHTGYHKGKSTYDGSVGLLYCYTEYIKSKKEVLTGHYKDMYQKENTGYKKAIETLLERIWDKIEELEAKL